MRKPDLFIVGAPKCGTTALYTYLKAHPDVFMSPLKEPGFFAEDILGDFRDTRTLQEYLRCFEGATVERRVGEASTAYLASEQAPAAIKAFQPAARIIIMLRDPVELMYSWHSELLNDGMEVFTSFETALYADELQQRRGMPFPGRRVVPSYMTQATFSPKVQRYLDVFGRDKVLVVLLDDFKTDPRAAFRSILGFLDVSPGFQPRFSIVNRNWRPRSKVIQDFLRRPPVWIRRASHTTMPLAARRFAGRCIRWLNTDTRPRPPMSAALHNRLRRWCEPDLQELSGILGRDLKSRLAP